jgi:hypothetical protein
VDDKNTLSKKLGNEGAAAENEDDFSSLSQCRRGRGPLSSAAPRSGRKVAENVLGLADYRRKAANKIRTMGKYIFCTHFAKKLKLGKKNLKSGSCLLNTNYLLKLVLAVLLVPV